MKKRSDGKRGLKPFIQIGIVLAAVAVLFAAVRRNTMAFINENQVMKYSAYAANHTIENSTLFIGTYLINLSGMTDQVYEKALDSASDSNQTDMYYKSELSNGSWFNVTDAEGLTDITDSGEVVPESALADLYVQYYVGADGIITDVMTGDSLNPFDIPDPYDLSRLPELNPLWLQYTNSTDVDEISEDDYLKAKNSKESGNLRGDVYTYRLLTAFF